MAKIFISFAHLDGVDLARRLNEHLKQAGHQVWIDEEGITPGDVWSTHIEEALNATDITIALISEGSNKSEICIAEQERSLKLNKRVIPVLVQQDIKPLIHLGVRHYIDFSDPDCFDEQIRHLLDAVEQRGIHQDFIASRQINPLPAPLPPDDFIPRPDIQVELRARVLHHLHGDQLALTALQAMGGMGKTILAQALCHDPEIQAAFPDGIFWISVGREAADLKKSIDTLVRMFGGEPSHYGASTQLNALLGSRAVLLVFDDVWDSKLIEPFVIRGDACFTLITTRRHSVAEALHIHPFRLDTLPLAEAVDWLRRWSGRGEPEFAEIAERIDCLPLALRLIGVRLHRGMSGKDWLRLYSDHISQLTLTGDSQDKNLNLTASIDLSVVTLNEHQPHYHSLGIFPEDVWIPAAVAIELWKSLQADKTVVEDEITLYEQLETLDDLALVELNRSNNTFALHDVLHDYNRHKLIQANRLLLTHQALLNIFRGAESKPCWSILSEVDQNELAKYMHYQFAYHMLHAGDEQRTELFRMLEQLPNWLLTDRQVTSTEPALLAAWHVYSSEKSAHAHDLIRQWMTKPLRLTPTAADLVLHFAFLAGFDDLIVLGMEHRDEAIRTAAMTRLYYRYRQNADDGLSILARAAHNVRRYGVTSMKRGKAVMETMLNIATYEYQHTYLAEDVSRLQGAHNLEQLGRVLSDLLYRGLLLDIPMMRLFTSRLYRTALRLAVKHVEDRYQMLADKGKHDVPLDTWITLPEAVHYYEHTREEKERLWKVFRCWNRHDYNITTDVTIDEMIACWDGTIAAAIPEFAVVAYGGTHPDDVLPILRTLFNHPSQTYRATRQLQMLSCLCKISTMQERVPGEFVSTAKALMQAYYDNRHDGYGLYETYLGCYEYFPLIWYSRMWNKWQPMQPVDLIDKYFDYSAKNQNTALTIHILRGFADPRVVFANLSPILLHFNRFFEGNSAQQAVDDWLIKALANLRNRDQATVDSYLSHVKGHRRYLVDQIKERSYHEPVYFATLSLADFIYALLAFTPRESLAWFYDHMEEIFYQESMTDMLMLLFTHLTKLYLPERHS